MGEVSYQFDADGLMGQRGLDLVTYNSAGLLTTITRLGKFTYSYFYDPLNRLSIQKDRRGNILQFFYADTRDRKLVTHVYNHTTGSITQYFRDSDGCIISLQRGDSTYYIMSDPNQSPMIVLDSNGNIVKRVSYNPLGYRVFDSNPDFQLSFGFQGGLYNPTTQLVHFSDRVYDTQLGSFLTPNYNEVFDKLSKIVQNPEILNLYRHRDMVNVHLKRHKYPRTGQSFLKLYI